MHTDDRAARLNRELSARAFTYGNHVFFGQGEYQPRTSSGQRLIAHELTHTLQQTSGPSRQPLGVQRLGISDALDYFADKAYLIPGYRLFTLVIGVNPINMAKVPRTAANLLRALVELIPGGNLLVRVLDRYGVFDKAGAWIEQRFAALGLSGARVRADLMRFLKSLGWRDIFRLGSVWTRAKEVFLGPIRKLLGLAAGLGAKLLEMIRGAVLEPLAKLASKTRGYDLLKALLGRDPITGKKHPRTAASVIGGVMKLIGQEELWKNIVKAKAVPRAWAWFQGALKGLLGILAQAPARFLAALKSLTLTDFLLLPKAFIKLGGVFVSLIGQVLRWGGQTIWSLLEIVFDVVAPGLRAKLAKAKGALRSILKNPIGFLRNLLRAGKLGFNNFVKGFVGHLKGALIGWLTGNLGGAGVHIPKALSFKEILPFVLDVLGLGWAALRQRLVKAVGETAVKAMEGGFTLIKTLITKGPAGVWQQLKQSLGNLKDTVLNGIIDFVQGSVVKKAVFKLLSMLSPVGAFIQSIIAIYDTVMFFVERLSQIGQLLSAVLGSLAAIAAGKVKPAAKKVEQALATSLTLVISFLARFVGLGGIGKALKKIIEKVRKPVGKALDKVVKWIVAKARKLGKWVAQIGAPKDPNKRLKAAKRATLKAVKHLGGKLSQSALRPVFAAIRARYGLKKLEARQVQGKWQAKATVNPDITFDMIKSDNLAAAKVGRVLQKTVNETEKKLSSDKYKDGFGPKIRAELKALQKWFADHKILLNRYMKRKGERAYLTDTDRADLQEITAAISKEIEHFRRVIDARLEGGKSTPSGTPKGRPFAKEKKVKNIHLFRKLDASSEGKFLLQAVEEGAPKGGPFFSHRDVKALMAGAQRKFFATHEQHIQEIFDKKFQNPEKRRSQMIVKVTLSLSDYQAMVKAANPAHAKGSYDDGKAVVHQEGFAHEPDEEGLTTSVGQLEAIIEKGEHHSIGFPIGLMAELDKCIKEVQWVDVQLKKPAKDA
ncbi:MAG: DUF4157 domain-containing protein [Alphaproteobacteria bacterium]|nr:DUF4157 domain-containing protein [Alphaproteobacteria bacterium]MCB9795351.1 DUF4157 domain-containing protein [Alphaproteobacteria bacterium]